MRTPIRPHPKIERYMISEGHPQTPSRGVEPLRTPPAGVILRHQQQSLETLTGSGRSEATGAGPAEGATDAHPQILRPPETSRGSSG